MYLLDVLEDNGEEFSGVRFARHPHHSQIGHRCALARKRHAWHDYRIILLESPVDGAAQLRRERARGHIQDVQARKPGGKAQVFFRLTKEMPYLSIRFHQHDAGVEVF